LKQGSKGLCSSYGITLNYGEDRVKVGSDFQRLPSKPQILTTKLNLSVDQENIKVKVEGDSQE
jgi:hypothetical protein